MAICFLISSCTAFLPGGGREGSAPGREIMAGGGWPELYESMLFLCFFLFLFILGRVVYREVRRRKVAARMAAGNHPAIPESHYISSPLPEQPGPEAKPEPQAVERNEEEVRQQTPPSLPAAPPEQEELPEGYTFYTQLDQLEED
jgi:hypothetical protein